MGHLWKNNLPKKCKFFIWSILHKGLNTHDKMQKRYPSLNINPSWCILCKNNEETGEHLFITCHCSQFLWATFFGYLKHNRSSPQNMDEVINLLIPQKSATKPSILLSNLVGATLWSIWLERNNRTFHNKSKSLAHLWEDIINLSSFWCKKSILFSSYDVATISLNWRSIL